MSAQADIRTTGETKERSDAINRIMQTYGEAIVDRDAHIAKLQGLTCILVLALVCTVGVSRWIVYKSGACEQEQSYTQPAQPAHKKGGLDYTIKP